MNLVKVIENILSNVCSREQVSSVTSLLDNKKNIFVPSENNELEVVPIENILYVQEVKAIAIIKTLENEYKYNNPSCDLIEFLTQLSSDFKGVNTGLCINMEKIVCFDSYYRTVYFKYDGKSGNNLSITANGKAMNNIINKGARRELDLQSEKNQGAYFCSN